MLFIKCALVKRRALPVFTFVVIEVYPPSVNPGIFLGGGLIFIFNSFFLVSFQVSFKCNKSQCTFEYFNYQFIKQVALLKSVPHLKFVKLIFGEDQKGVHDF